MRLSIWSFNILRSKPNPPPSPLLRGNPLGIWTFEHWFIQIPIAFPIVGKNCVQIPYQVPDSIVIYLSICKRQNQRQSISTHWPSFEK